MTLSGRLCIPCAFRLPAFASWDILHPLESSAALTIGLPITGTPSGLSRFAWVICGWVRCTLYAGVWGVGSLTNVIQVSHMTQHIRIIYHFRISMVTTLQMSIHFRSPFQPLPRPCLWGNSSNTLGFALDCSVGLSRQLHTCGLLRTHVTVAIPLYTEVNSLTESITDKRLRVAHIRPHPAAD